MSLTLVLVLVSGAQSYVASTHRRRPEANRSYPLEAARLLLAHGANPNAIYYCETPHSIARKANREEMMQLLEEYGADADLSAECQSDAYWASVDVRWWPRLELSRPTGVGAGVSVMIGEERCTTGVLGLPECEHSGPEIGAVLGTGGVRGEVGWGMAGWVASFGLHVDFVYTFDGTHIADWLDASSSTPYLGCGIDVRLAVLTLSGGILFPLEPNWEPIGTFGIGFAPYSLPDSD